MKFSRPQILRTIYGRLWVLLLACLLLPVLFCALVHCQRLWSRKTDAIQHSLGTARSGAAVFQQFVDGIVNQELLVALAIAASTSPGQVDLLFQETQAGREGIRSLSWIDPGGRVVYASLPGMAGMEVADQPEFKAIVDGREWAVGNLTLSRRFEEPVFTINRGLRDPAGHLVGVVSAVVSPACLGGLFPTGWPGKGELILIDGNGRGVLRWPETGWRWEERDRSGWLDRSAAAREKGSTSPAPGVLEDRERILALVPIDTLGWTAGAVRLKSDLREPFLSAFRGRAAFFWLAAAAMVLTAFWAVRSIRLPLKTLQQYARNLNRNGPESGLEPLPLTELTKLAELAELAGALDQLAAQGRLLKAQGEARAEAAGEANRILESLLAHLPGGAMICDPSQERIRATNLSRPSLAADASATDGCWAFCRPLAGAAAEGDSPLARAARGESLRGEEWIMKAPDGAHMQVLLNAGPVFDAQGAITGRVIAWQDITHLKKTEAALRRLEQVYLALVEKGPEPVLRVDRELRCTYVNPAWEEASGLSRSAMAGQRLDQMEGPVPAGHLQLIHNTCQAVFASGREQALEVPVRTPSGTRCFQVRLVPELAADHGVAGVFVVLRDLTGQKLLQKKVEAVRITADLKCREEARRAEELAAVLESVPDGLVIHNMDGEMVQMNPAGQSLLGYHGASFPLPAGEHLGWSSLKAENGRELDREELPAWQALQGKTLRNRIVRFTPANEDRTVWLAMSAAPLIVPDGRQAGAVVTFTDITSRKGQEEENRSHLKAQIRQRRFLERLIEGAPVGMAVVQGPSLDYVLTNRRYREMLEPAQAAGNERALAGILPARLAKIHYQLLAEMGPAGRPKRLKAYEAPGPGGEPTWWDIDLMPVPGDSGKMEAMLILAAEVTEEVVARRRAETRTEKAQAESAQLRAVIDKMSDAVILTDFQWEIKLVNRAGLELYGFGSVEEFKERLNELPNLIQHTDPQGKPVPKGECPPALALRGESFANWELVVKRRDTDKKWIGRYGGFPIHSHTGQIEMAAITCHDITEFKRLEAELKKTNELLEEKVRERTEALAILNEELKENAARMKLRNQELEDYAFIASHHLQEPLRKIQVFVDLIMTRYSGSFGDEAREYFQRIAASAAKVRSLIEAIDRYSRLTNQKCQVQTVQVRDIIEKVLAGLKSRLGEADLQLEISEKQVVIADPDWLQTLFFHLIDNALKFSGNQTPVIRINDHPPPGMMAPASANENGFCRIYVEDNGIGFDEKYRKRIFQPLQRLHVTEGYAGVGMGLAICKKIAEHFGGEITAVGRPGEGAIFVLMLPQREKK